MTHPLLLLGPGGEYRRAWPEEDETMTMDGEPPAMTDDAFEEQARVWGDVVPELIAEIRRLREVNNELLGACQAGQAYMACLKRCWDKDEGNLIDSRGVMVAETADIDRLFDVWHAATTAAIAKAKGETG